ncbi:MAG: dicarboxylate/amino acid:cation symporter [Planctomycetota bacterium]|nr:MAG: dicarboxylate/amino acid:cation symporter [Planctomycetota bacterium]REJ96095.1 MAG: dicarboxylate/amino acid:cation symporter [Planctomycetota bacterium]REK21867.1 MAG: dicarboxylate/amino acid:cation symporter [Planctomycetota bacterium]REK46675.1 MAG: dicarboxylate/amino acid:cation symporter [Planctomycetota bacterium]
MLRLALHWQILITMIIGAVVGAVLNRTVGTHRTDGLVEIAESGTAQLHGMSKSAAYRAGTAWFDDTPSRVLIQINEQAAGADKFTTRRIIVRSAMARAAIDEQLWPAVPAQADPDLPVETKSYATIKELQKQDPAAFVLFHFYGRSWGRTVGDYAQKIGNLFLRMLKMVSIPLIITSLLTGVIGLGQTERLGRMFSRTLFYYVSTSLLAIVTGLIMVNLIRPGVQPAAAPAAGEEVAEAEAADGVARAAGPAGKVREGKGLGTVLFEQLEKMIPDNPFDAVVDGLFISIIAFTLIFGVFTVLEGGRHAQTLGELSEAGFHVMMRMTMAIIRLAPLGVLFLMLAVTASQGIGVFESLGYYMITVACALAFHAVVTMPMILKFVARTDPIGYARAMSPALLTAFSSASSNATLPLTMTCCEQRGGISNRTTSFVLPLGATVNMDGTALYEVVAVLFIAQFSGFELTLIQQIIVAITALLASIGAAGIPHAGLVMMVIILQAVGLPLESQGLIIAVDRVLDMCRTSVNVWSDSCGCAVVERMEGPPAAVA